MDTIFICVDSSVGSCNAPSKEYSEKDTAVCIYDSIGGSWFFVRDSVCSGTGAFVWHEYERDDWLDCCRAALGFHPWDQ